MKYEDAAVFATVEGWVCKTCKRWYADEEHLARWCCATDLPCEECDGRRTSKTWSCCKDCREKKDKESRLSLKRRAWNGEPLYSEALDRFIFGYSDLADAYDEAADNGRFDLRLVFAEPVYAREIDGDYWFDDLADDQCIYDIYWLEEIVREANKEIRQHRLDGDEISWWPGEVVPEIEPFAMVAESEVTD